ncbi:MBL fold metallo-hydrolase [Catenisphaera adipataccumulans]|uniref:L-ascorbate metabolism protein UlaG (Beta-lactamase superfamily) n=1 Tax=Catenisphaera adipataccumulans TaxID=700500 RepID=A0A7W8CWS5_9FIRM|nr:MBL fold metallo-hydrolase [Catenisphaera adipataccumulans]MBB5182998.1 L-ascorbate metabolism protein UlaG (beta-lactamase superfamily) [Catenisphaera adipataccumulans]
MIQIKWLGHSCFQVIRDDFIIVFDPYKDGSVPGYPPLRTEADLVLCSHEHADHSGRECVKKRQGHPDPWQIAYIDSFHDENHGRQRGTNRIYILSDGTKKIVHMGDIGCPLMPEQEAKLKNADVMMMPVGGFYTLEPARIKHIADRLQPRVLIPMHYRHGPYGYSEIQTIDPYLKLCDPVVRIHDSVYLVEDVDKPQTVVLPF